MFESLEEQFRTDTFRSQRRLIYKAIKAAESRDWPRTASIELVYGKLKEFDFEIVYDLDQEGYNVEVKRLPNGLILNLTW
jgi:hypothetical protein